MNEFLEWLKTYISSQFANDSDITKTVTVENANKQGNEITTSNVPQVQVQLMDNAEVDQYSSLEEGEHVTSIPVQITSYTGQMKIKNAACSAQEASIIFGDKIKNMITASNMASANTNIKRCRRTTMSPALQLLDGSKVYYTAVRFEFWIANPYT